MPIKIKTDLEWGQTFYLKNDEAQLDRALVGVVLLPGNTVKFQLSLLGEIVEAYDFECSSTKDLNKTLNMDKEE